MSGTIVFYRKCLWMLDVFLEDTRENCLVREIKKKGLCKMISWSATTSIVGLFATWWGILIANGCERVKRVRQGISFSAESPWSQKTATKAFIKNVNGCVDRLINTTNVADINPVISTRERYWRWVIMFHSLSLFLVKGIQISRSK